MAFKIRWIDHHREPQCAPDPNYPDGKDIPLPHPAPKSCRVELPYPAKRCGVYIVECSICRLSVAITTAGRPDDPRSAQLPCLRTVQ